MKMPAVNGYSIESTTDGTLFKIASFAIAFLQSSSCFYVASIFIEIQAVSAQLK